MALPLAEKIERLIAFAHRYGEPALSSEQIAAALTPRVARVVTVDQITALRDGSMTEIADDLARELCQLCHCLDDSYLTPIGDEDIDIDQRLRLWTLARDRGLEHLAARAPGTMSRPMLEELIADIELRPVSGVTLQAGQIRR
ncbi:hypothetical protein OG225_42770 (plasmid) [Nocardia sp. NBC_01377]|uniref:hypothetical protein n=1 Tax=Nocardia sp. NBC_01377 TaxID=2903595 RepID=UPI002F907E81